MASFGDTQKANHEKSHVDIQSNRSKALEQSLTEFPPPPISTHPSRTMATIDDDDERLLARIGYKQVWSFN